MNLKIITGHDKENWYKLYFSEGDEEYDPAVFLTLNRKDFLDAADMMEITAKSIRKHTKEKK